MSWVQPGREFAALVHSFERSAWRWECQGTYREPTEREPMQRWRDGHPDYAFMDEWLALIREHHAAGRTFERVRMVTEPLTEYLEWMTSFTHLNVDAGEDIRWITEGRARELGSGPGHDFYVFDDQRVAVLHFDDNGVRGAEVTDDPDLLAEHQAWRATVWPVATPHYESTYAPTRSP